MSFQKAQVIFSSNLASIFNAIKHNSSVLFLSQTLCTSVKSSTLKYKFLRFSSALMKIFQISHVIFQTTSHFFKKFGVTLQCHEIQLLCSFIAEILYTLVKSNPLKSTFLRLSSARIKIRQILYVNFEMTNQFLFRFFIILQCYYT